MSRNLAGYTNPWSQITSLHCWSHFSLYDLYGKLSSTNFIGITFYFEFISSYCLLFWQNGSFFIPVVCVLRWISLKCSYNFVQFRVNSRRRWKASRIATEPAVLLIQNHVCSIFLWRFCCSNTQPNLRFYLQVSHCEDTIHSLKQKLSDKLKEVGWTPRRFMTINELYSKLQYTFKLKPWNGCQNSVIHKNVTSALFIKLCTSLRL